ncbi:MAG TPA: hypothetical protein VGI58_18645 [Streptosporangiaceae bacterium]|jgi:hypothetical protein
MSGPGDIGGEVSGDEAAWRDIVAHYDAAEDTGGEAAPWPAREDLPDAAGSTPGRVADRTRVIRPSADGLQYAADGQAEAGRAETGQTGTGQTGTGQTGTGQARAGQTGTGQARAGQAGAGQSAAESEEAPADERYIPPPLPPPAKLDSLAKAAWVAVICGPAYLLIGTFLQWSIPGIAAFAAVAAFIGGFVALVVRLGDRPRRDDDDDGAVL